MQHEAGLTFFCRLMRNLQIQTLRFAPDTPPPVTLGMDHLKGYEDQAREFFSDTRSHTLYIVQDTFHFSFSFLLLPETNEILLVGPYLSCEVTEQEMMQLLERNQLSPSLLPNMKRYYANLRRIHNEDHLFVVMNTLCESLWGGANAYEIKRLNTQNLLCRVKSSEPPLTHTIAEVAGFKLAEQRYEGEKQLMYLVSQGHSHRAQMLVSQIGENTLENRAADPVRNIKNYGIVLNTLLRKAVEQGGVHPLHIDTLSSQMARKLENAHTVEECRQIYAAMVHKYCLLVRNHSMKGYSLLVQHVILRIEADLTADLSLKAHAEALSVNASYLSTLFKKETGVTLTDYVTRMRIDNAVFLLNATDMQIQTIAQHCGIPDVNYFTKTFKRLVGRTPKEYRIKARENK